MKLHHILPALALAAGPACAQDLNLGGQPGSPPVPIQITAQQGITWSQDAQTVTATGSAKAVRGDVTVTADELVAHYVKKPGATAPAKPGAASAPATPAADASPLDQGDAQLTELDAIGNVHIYTPTDNAWGDHAVYMLNQQVLVLTGAHLKLTTPHDTVTAKNSIEYYSGDRKAIARGNALIVADDGRSVAADVITGWLTPEPAAPAPGQAPAPKPAPAQNADALESGGSLQRAEAVGHVVIRTTSDTATGDRAVYLPPSGRARIGGNVHIIHGPNELAGSDALVNMKTGVATLLAGPGGQVSGVILPNSGKQQSK